MIIAESEVTLYFALISSLQTVSIREAPLLANEISTCGYHVYIYLIQNSQAVKKVCGPQKGYGEKRCEIQGGGQEMAVMVG